jgi:DNA replication factor GINS
LAEITIEYLKRHLDAEELSEKLTQVPPDLYTSVASYAQLLKRTSGSGNSEVANRLVAKQSSMLEAMVRRLLETRARKALAQKAISQLLPEERHVVSAGESYRAKMRDFVEAVSSGQPSAVESARRNEMARSATVRFLKHVNELVGPDLRRYGPFEPEDLASLPAASAEVLVASGEAVEVRPRD